MKKLLLLLSLLTPITGLGASGGGKVDASYIEAVRQGSAPSSPASGKARAYVLDSDGKFYVKNSSGTAKACTYSGDVVNADLSGSAAITNANLANMTQSTFKCRTTASTGAPEDCTAAQGQAIVGSVPQVLAHQSTPSNPAAGSVKIYPKSDNEIYVLDSSGTEKALQSATSGIGTITSFTMTVTGTTSNPTKSTSISSEVATYQCIGSQLMRITWDYRGTSGGADGSGAYLLTIPNSKSIDTSLRGTLPGGQSAHIKVGYGMISVASAGFNSTSAIAEVFAYDSTHLFLAYPNAANTKLIWGSSNIPMSTNPLIVSIVAEVPISGSCN